MFHSEGCIEKSAGSFPQLTIVGSRLKPTQDLTRLPAGAVSGLARLLRPVQYTFRVGAHSDLAWVS